MKSFIDGGFRQRDPFLQDTCSDMVDLTCIYGLALPTTWSLLLTEDAIWQVRSDLRLFGASGVEE